jgi:arylsulfatase A
MTSVKRRQFLSAASASALCAMLGAPALGDTRRKPNFIVILCDDLGFGDVESNGGIVPTPNISRLAREGVTLENYYAPANLCTPSRAGLLTGRYPIRTGLGWEVLQANDKRGLPLSERTIADVLKPAYSSALIGKWHLGTAPEYWPPTKHGFDLFYGIPYSHDMEPLKLYEASATSGKIEEGPAVLSALQQQFYSRAELFIEENSHRPFFLELALSAPHLPERPSAAFAHTSQVGAYGDVLREIDSIVGRLLNKLDELSLSNDTLVIFTSDNGPWYEGSSGPLRDRKGGDGFDGASHVPFLARMPGTIPAGTRRQAIASGIDLLPTFCAMAGLPPPAGVELDGKDISGVLERGTASPHDEIVLFNNEDVVAVRTQRWKYVIQSYYRGAEMHFQGNDNKLYDYDELYDLELDRSESYSAADLYPAVLADMKNRLAAAKDKYAPFKRGMPPGFNCFYDKCRQE